MRAIGALCAECFEFSYVIGVGNEINDLSKGVSFGITVKAYTYYILFVCIYSSDNKVLEISEKLRLVYNNTFRLVKLLGF